MPLKVHFLNVGQGDCSIIEFPSGRIGMVDIHNLKSLDTDTKEELIESFREFRMAQGTYSTRQLEEAFIKSQEEKLTDPLEYYESNIGTTTDIFRMVVTHPDMDHMTGLHRLYEQDPWKDILNFWHTGAHDFNLADASDEDWESSPYDKRDWEVYQQLRESTGRPKNLGQYQGATGSYWTEDGVEIWAPTPDLEDRAVELGEPNVLSMVLKISYAGRTILLGGDATRDETWPAICSSIAVAKVDVLKASHHGRKTGYYQPAVKQMSPWLTITSVGEKAYDATESYRRYSDYTVSLRQSGDIRITVQDDGKLLYSPNAAEHWKPKKTS